MNADALDRPLVSVLMITYRHEAFIAQAIESVLMQKAAFPYELVIGEDKSPDATLEIVHRYQAAHPERIRVLSRERNVGMMRNLIETYRECRGKYVAILEGDDYWTDPDKLQLQVDAMESHPDWALCFHRTEYVNHDSTQSLGRGFDDIPTVTTLDDLLEKYYLTTLSILFRRDLIEEFPDWYESLPMGDWPLTILLALHGNIGYLERSMGHYRIHPAGAYSGASWRQRMAADATMYRHVRTILDPDRATRVTARVVRLSVSLIAYDFAAGNAALAWQETRILFRTEPWALVAQTLLRGVARRLMRPLLQSRRAWQVLPGSLRRAIEAATRQ